MSLAACSKDGAGSLNPMSFTDQHGNAVLERLRYQRATGRFCDVLIVVKEKQFCAHRNILAACSPYFDSILKHGKIVKEKVTVNCQNPMVFELLLNYMYSGSVVIDRSVVTELLKLSNNLLIMKLKSYCAEYLERYIDAANCLSVKELANKYNLPALLRKASEFFDSNINGCLLESVDILEYNLTQIKALLSEPKYQGTIRADVYLNLIARWVSHRLHEREGFFKELISQCPFQMLNPQKLERMLDFNPLFTQSESCCFAILQAMYDHRMPMTKYEFQYRNLYAKYRGGQPAGISAILNYDTTNTFVTQAGIIGRQLDRPHSEPEGSIEDDFEDDIPDDGSAIGEEHENMELTMIENSQNDPPAHIGDQPRPSLKLKINLGGAASTPPSAPLLKKKKLLGKSNAFNKLFRKSMSAANQIIAKRRGRPPKFRRPPIDFTQINEEPQTKYYEFEEDPNSAVIFEEPDDLNPEIPHEETPEDQEVQATMEGELNRANENIEHPDFSCDHCIFRTRSPSKLKKHMANSHSKNILYICNICRYECRWNRAFYDHMRQHFQGPPFQCDSCPYTVDRIHVLLSHRLTHTDEKPYKCPDCDFRCLFKHNMIMHHRIHSGEKPYECPDCKKRFALKPVFDQHISAHTEDRPFVCDQCGFSTKYQSHLISHRRVHSGDLFFCTVTGCNYSSPKKSQLAAHLRTHMAVRSHQCKICNRCFIEKSHLVRHERIHLEEKPFKCDNCEYSSSRRDKLKEHILKHHNSSANSKAQRRRYRRAKQLAALAAQAKLHQPDPGNFFRPIMHTNFPQSNISSGDVPGTSGTQQPPPPPQQQQPQQIIQQRAPQVQRTQQEMMGMHEFNVVPHIQLNRPSSEVPNTTGNPLVPLSPSLSLNFDLTGTADYLADNFTPTPRIDRSADLLRHEHNDELVTPIPQQTSETSAENLRNPHSVYATHSRPAADDFFAGLQQQHQQGEQQPQNDPQRPMSLPPYGAELRAAQLQLQQQAQFMQLQQQAQEMFQGQQQGGQQGQGDQNRWQNQW